MEGSHGRNLEAGAEEEDSGDLNAAYRLHPGSSSATFPPGQVYLPKGGMASSGPDPPTLAIRKRPHQQGHEPI